MRRAEPGFAYVAAIVFLLVLAGLALAALRLSGSEQATVSRQALAARANQAARAGLEWAFYQLRGAQGSATDASSAAYKACNTTIDKQTLTDFAAATGFKVTLQCSMKTWGEGQRLDSSGATAATSWQKNIYQVTAVACNGAAACPDAVPADIANPDYVERGRTASICIDTTGADCY